MILPITTLTSFIRTEAAKVKEKANNSHTHGKFERYVQTRFVAVLLIPGHFLSSVADTVVGVGAAVINIGCSLTMHDGSYRVAGRYLSSSNDLLAGPFGHLIQVIDPKTDCFGKSRLLTGLVNTHMTEKLFTFAQKSSLKGGFLSKHVISRVAFGLTTISSPFTRLIDLVIGLIAAPFALVAAFFGKGKELGAFTCRQLKVGGVVQDVVLGVIRTINPWVGQNPSTNNSFRKNNESSFHGW